LVRRASESPGGPSLWCNTNCITLGLCSKRPTGASGPTTHRKHGVTPQQANEALADTARVVIDPDPAQKPGGRGVRIIGWSDTAARILTVSVVEHDGIVYGATAFKSNETDQNRY
jgi:hypothetical protein